MKRPGAVRCAVGDAPARNTMRVVHVFVRQCRMYRFSIFESVSKKANLITAPRGCSPYLAVLATGVKPSDIVATWLPAAVCCCSSENEGPRSETFKDMFNRASWDTLGRGRVEMLLDLHADVRGATEVEPEYRPPFEGPAVAEPRAVRVAR